MVIFLLLTAAVCLPEIKIAPCKQLNSDYISKSQTTAINGIFTLLVFLSHVSTYIKTDGSLDAPYTAFKAYMLQAVVVPFLFYSGYGIMESIKAKGTAYVKQIPLKRFLPVLLHFDIAVVLYLIVNLCFGKVFSLSHILLAFTGYNSVGNSNWYIFAVLGLYIITFVAFMLAKNNHILGIALTTVFSVGFVFAQMLLKRSSWCYDTVILFSVGMIFSAVKPFAEKIIAKHNLIYLLAVVSAVAAYSVFYKKRGAGIEFYSMWAILFMALIVLFTMKVKIANPILNFFGSHVFSIYILQRIPMIIFSRLGLAASNKYIFVVLCFALTLIMAVIFDKLMHGLDGLISGGIKNRQKSK